MENQMEVTFPALGENESFARMVIAAFLTDLDPTIEEMTEIKTAVSEAVTNAIIHGYEGNGMKLVRLTATRSEDMVQISVVDEGVGMDNIEQARQPLFTTKAELERSGMGITIMESFMDSCEIESTRGVGTTVKLTKYFLKKPICA